MSITLMQSKLAAKCKACGLAYPKGGWISKDTTDRTAGWSHVECMTDTGTAPARPATAPESLTAAVEGMLQELAGQGYTEPVDTPLGLLTLRYAAAIDGAEPADEVKTLVALGTKFQSALIQLRATPGARADNPGEDE